MTQTVDLSTCDREPIHIPGAIQSHGAMVVCDPSRVRVRCFSQNIATILGPRATGDLAGRTLSEIIGEEADHEVRNALARAGDSEIAGVLLGVKTPGAATAVDLLVHAHKDLMFVEIEPSIDGGKNAHGALDTTQTLIRRIALESDVQGIAAAGAKLIRAMLGYDRVMIYQFLHNGAGKVVAEARRPGMNSFMGQHFPASDIPYQARRLYLANTIRMIGDVGSKPVPLHPALAAGAPPVDMTFAQLRSVSPIHCAYLQNMGVAASLSISIVVDGELWGLISCHHDSPRLVPMPLRIGAELFGQFFSLQISVAQRGAQILASTIARDRLDKLMTGLGDGGSFAQNLRGRLADFKALIEADGVGVWFEGAWDGIGVTPPAEVLPGLLDIIRSGANGAVFETQDIAGAVATTEPVGAVAGVLAIPLSAQAHDYLMFFRREEAFNIEWAGEPVKNLVATPQGLRLTPRGSFETWREEVRNRSKPWTASELAVADAIRTYLRDVVLRRNEETAEERARAEQRRRVLNDELNHRVKNIIALVKSIALQTGAHASSVAEYSDSLEGRLRALAFAHDQSLAGPGAGDLAALIEAEASLYRYGGAPERVTFTGDRVRLDDRTFGVLALVIHEMMTNAAKYGSLSVPEGRLRLAWRFTDAGDCEINWTESGGPRVVSPGREGFGTKLIQSTIGYDLGGSVQVDYDPGGVRARFIIPAAHVSLDTRSIAAPAAPADGGGSALTDLSILIVEDQALIAMDLQESLAKRGAMDVRLSPSSAEALDVLQSFEPNVAVLDFNLGAETAEAVAEHLTLRRVPFVFATGYGDSVMIPQRFRHVPVVRKPVNPVVLAAKIWAALESAADSSAKTRPGSPAAAGAKPDDGVHPATPVRGLR